MSLKHMARVGKTGFLLHIFSLPFNNRLNRLNNLLPSSLTVCVWPTSAGVKGNLTESERYILANLIATGTAIPLAVYFLVWQTYVMRADVIIGSVLLVAYGLDGVLALSTLARLARLVPLTQTFYVKTSPTVTDEEALLMSA